ncbi:hypothetical protein EYF80_021590 [Liparis tanakae]|uniref:Uncharacterized protein n=1 Tax=Liparis tanakae TaxID=230148 RepID=A0A4Z2HQW2_9TELE|nr:hypothetical protein EYF80_021590 [Liparis tanakae]
MYGSTTYLAWLSFCFRRCSSSFLVFSAFCSSTSFLCACTRRVTKESNEGGFERMQHISVTSGGV